MDDVNIYPEPNPALTAILKGPKMFAVVRAKTAYAKAQWQVIVKKRSRRLAASARTSVQIGGYKNDRPVGRLTVGRGLKYGASHQFGYTERRDATTGRFVARSGSRKGGVRTRKVAGAKELNTVLRRMRNS
ncbi:hypothetical protein [Mycolicibacterium wolinskyi]|uniref:hypothetical protein n=1 Tax=Mycolicibacterium wolinskyi TaxID=59750 RepID=UPI0039179BB8